MKISKLFHWLYAMLMLLPFAFFVPSVLYYAFNDNATMQTVEVPKTETFAVDFNQLQGNSTYTYSGNFNTYSTKFDTDYGDLLNVNDKILFKFDYRTNADLVYLCFGNPGFQPNNTSSASLTNDGEWHHTEKITTLSSVFETWHKSYFMSFTTNTGITFDVTDFQLFNLTRMFGVGNEPTSSRFNELFPNSYYSYTESELMQITYDTGEIEQLVENTSIINYAWESIWDLPLFSWTKITFVSVPFSYLTGIFGLGASNSLNYVFGYFVTISIVWLVFDLLLYVPMLAHNWIDKARIE